MIKILTLLVSVTGLRFLPARGVDRRERLVLCFDGCAACACRPALGST